MTTVAATFRVNLFNRSGDIVQWVQKHFENFPREYLPEKGDSVTLTRGTLAIFTEPTVGRRTLVCDPVNPTRSVWELELKTDSEKLINELRRMDW